MHGYHASSPDAVFTLLPHSDTIHQVQAVRHGKHDMRATTLSGAAFLVERKRLVGAHLTREVVEAIRPELIRRGTVPGTCPVSRLQERGGG